MAEVGNMPLPEKLLKRVHVSFRGKTFTCAAPQPLIVSERNIHDEPDC